MIMNGEIGRYENVRYIEQTNIAKSAGRTRSRMGVLLRRGHGGRGIAVPEEVRGKIRATTVAARVWLGIIWWVWDSTSHRRK